MAAIPTELEPMGKLHRRRIRTLLMNETGWSVESHVNGTVDVRPPSSVAGDSATERIQEVLQREGYKPRFLGGAAVGVIRFDTPETREQEGEGAHGFRR